MYEIVKTRRQQKAFEHTWEYFCHKYGWCNDPYAKNGIRYNLLLHNVGAFRQKKVIGTIEFIPYDPKNTNSTVEGPTRWEFSKYEEVRLHQERIWEIDKLCIHQDYQRQGYLQHIVHILYDHAVRNKPKYYLALIEKKLYRMLRISFGIGVERKGEELVGPQTVLIPILFDIEKIMQDEERVKRFLGDHSLHGDGQAKELLRHDQDNRLNKSLIKRIFTFGLF